MRSWMNWPSGFPVITSMTRPSTSTDKPYSNVDARLMGQRYFAQALDLFCRRHVLPADVFFR